MVHSQHLECLLVLVQVCLPLLSVLYFWSVMRWRARSRGRPLPPGPPPLPIVGNLFNMPRSKQWVEYQKLCRELGKRDCLTLGVGTDCARRRGCPLLSDAWPIRRRARKC